MEPTRVRDELFVFDFETELDFIFFEDELFEDELFEELLERTLVILPRVVLAFFVSGLVIETLFKLSDLVIFVDGSLLSDLRRILLLFVCLTVG